ncbi:Mitochondrial 39S ribosomal protein L18 [Fasciolopsis buskii]|uniref:Large ribosomal subunit protein uL18m n=1 Tax=Fasciolopsis buskii TaxID=27845 RepID=A0A8E0RWA2_9TREM|nr:Mitochondrial 39S ribosomal protein L18 [Fasciolopsis buski]
MALLESLLNYFSYEILWKKSTYFNFSINICPLINLKYSVFLGSRLQKPKPSVALLCTARSLQSFRSLELLGFSPKRSGWEFQSPRVDYWHKVCLKKSSYHTSGLVVHSSGVNVVFASTREPAIQRELYSCVDVSAAENIGRILAHRCHQCGLINLFFDSVESPLNNETVAAFYEALLEGGVNLEEPVENIPPEPLGVDYDSLTEEQRQAMYPSLIETLRTTPDWSAIPYEYSMRPVSRMRKLSPSFQVVFPLIFHLPKLKRCISRIK